MFVGNGKPPWAKAFAEDFDIESPVYSDPGRRFFKEAGMKRALGVGFKSVSHSKRAVSAGFMQGRVQGDAFQQGGVVVLDGQGEMLWQHADDVAGELLDIDVILGVVKGASKG